MAAKAALVEAAWWAMIPAAHVMECATTPGLPCAPGASMVRPNCEVNITGCSCKTPSNNQIVASTSCNTLRAGSGRSRTAPSSTGSVPVPAAQDDIGNGLGRFPRADRR